MAADHSISVVRQALVLRPGSVRPLRFVAVGGLSGLVQLSILAALLDMGWDGLAANVLAFLLAAQCNFWASNVFTWGDRRAAPAVGILVRWARFHALIAGSAALNLTVFALARHVTSEIPAAALGIAIGGATNFLLGDRFVFRASAGRPQMTMNEPTAVQPGGPVLDKPAR
ncbi:MAG TPA: GtrA family protein [Dehalococcoidia bacterium]|nr:GtrA family protein [Dehalococcoidia bacterium]